MTSALQPSSTKIDQLYLQLQVERMPVLVEMQHTQEVFATRSQRIVPMPNLPSCILGMLNQRSRVYWIVDLAALLGLDPLDPRSSSHMIAIIHHQGTLLGLAVKEVRGVIRFPAGARSFQTYSELDLGQRFDTHVEGYLKLPADDSPAAVLSADAIVHSRLWD